MEKKLTKRGSKRREQIVDVAFRLFAEQGYHGTAVGDICDELGVGKGVFYWYFESKEALFQELLKICLLDLRRAQQEIIEGESDPVQRIEKGIRASISFFSSDPGYLAVIRTAARYENFAGFLEEGQKIIVSDVAVHVKEGMAKGEIREGDAEFLAHGILGAIYHFVEVYVGVLGGGESQRPGLADEAAEFCLKGILV